jgi:hypothetical protein
MPRFLGVHWPRSAVPIGLAIGIYLNTLPPAQGQFEVTSAVEAWCALAVEPSQPSSTPQQPEQPAAIGQYRGNFDQFTPNGLGVLTFSETEALTRLYSLHGTELAQFPGWTPRFSPDQQVVVTSDREGSTDTIFTIEGQQLATLAGFYGFTPDSQHLLITSEAEQTSDLLDLKGRTIAELEGFLVAGRSTVEMTPDGRGSIVTIQGSPYDQTQQQVVVYDLAGQERFRSSQALLTLPDQRGFLTIFGPIERLNWDGEVEATLEGDRVASYLPDDSGLVTMNAETATTYLYTWEGTLLATLPGKFEQWISPSEGFQVIAASTPSADSFPWALTHTPTGDRYGLYTPDGTEAFTFETEGDRLSFEDISQDSQYLVLRSRLSPLSTQVRSRGGGEPLVLPGSFARLLPDGQGLITRNEAGEHFIYRWDGTLQGRFDWDLLDLL